MFPDLSVQVYRDLRTQIFVSATSVSSSLVSKANILQ